MLDISKIKAISIDLDDTLWPIWPTIERAERVLHDWLTGHAPSRPLDFAGPTPAEATTPEPPPATVASAEPAPAVREAPAPQQPCATLPEPPADAAAPGVDGSVPVPGWADWSAAAKATNFDSSLGAVGAAAAAGKQCIVAVGPGAGVAAAEPDGTVDNWVPFVPVNLVRDLNACPISIVDVGALRDDVAAGLDEDLELREAMNDALLELIDDPELTGDARVVEIGGSPARRLAQLEAAVDGAA